MSHPTLEIAQQMIDAAKIRGQQPLAFVIHPVTADALAKDLAEDAYESLGWWSKIWSGRKYRGAVAKLEKIHGVHVSMAINMPLGGLFLQVAGHEMRGQFPGGSPMPPAPNPPGVPAVARHAPAPAPAEETEIKPTLDDFATSSGSAPSVSDVLIKAIDGADALRGVVVVRVYKNGNIDLCTNVNPYELSGVLDHARMWSMQNGGG